MLKKLKVLKWRLLPLALAALILCLPLAENYWSRHQVSLAVHTAQAKLDLSPKAAKIQGSPNRILIPSLSIDLSVVSQSYSQVTKTWPVSASEANYATNTALPNNVKGESLIYGHNNRQVFGPVLNIQPNDIVYVYTDNGHIFKYAYVSSQDVTPTKLDIFNDMAKAPAGLKLITCDGPNFEYRHLMSLKLIQAV